MDKKIKIKIGLTIIITLICGLLGGLVIGYQGVFSKQLSFLVKTAEGEVAIKDSLTAEQVEEKIITYIREEVLGENGPEVSFTAPTTFQNGVYKLNLKIETSEFASYATKDGKLLFPEAIEMISEEEKLAKGCEDVKKAEQPILEAFVVSYCPYGTQMQRILVEILKNIPELRNNIKIRYIGSIQDGKITSMHGEEEAQENLTQICLRKEQEDKFLTYLSCFLKQANASACLIEAGVDESELESCKKDESRGIVYAQEDFNLNEMYQISGSPTLIINGQDLNTPEKPVEFLFGGRTAEAVKTLLCCGFENQVQFCENILTNEEATPGFSETYSSGSSASGICE